MVLDLIAEGSYLLILWNKAKQSASHNLDTEKYRIMKRAHDTLDGMYFLYIISMIGITFNSSL